jgi:hypothetical protein
MPNRVRLCVIMTYLCQPTVDCLRNGERPAWELEDELATRFNVTLGERAQFHPNSRCPVWTSDVAFALKKLVEAREIGASGKRRAPNGDMRVVYHLLRDDRLVALSALTDFGQT